MRKYYLLQLLSIFFLSLLTGCSSGGSDEPEPNPEPEPDSITLTTTETTVDYGSVKVTLNFKANAPWTATENVDWCTLSATSGTANVTSIVAELTENTAQESRSVQISFKAGSASATATIHQKKAPDPTPNPEEGKDDNPDKNEGQDKESGSNVEDMPNKKW